jgi:hypothetical protein
MSSDRRHNPTIGKVVLCHGPGSGTTYHAEVRQKVRVALQLPRVLVKVLVGPELGRVDEDAGHHHVVVLSRLSDQPQVPCEDPGGERE